MLSLSSFPSILISLLGITGIIVFHEFGHFIFCKFFNVYTPTFSLGMGPILYSKMFGHTKFCISAAPIGGYVEIATDQGIAGTKGFNEIAYWKKVCIMLGGIGCNFLLAYLIFAGLFFIGMPESGLPYQATTTTIKQVPTDSINASVLQAHDTIIGVGNNNCPVENNSDILKQEIAKVAKLDKPMLPATIVRNGTTFTVDLVINPSAPTMSKALQIAFEPKPALSLKDSFVQAYRMTAFCTQAIIQALKQFTSSSGKCFVGPIRAVFLSSQSAQKGFSHLLLFLAIISINLGFMNLLPLPIFDGGQFVIFTIEAITRRSLSDQTRQIIASVSWIIALGLMLLFSIRDIYALCF